MKLSVAVFGPLSMVSAILLLSYLSTFTTHNAEKKRERMNTAISLFLVITFAVLPSVSLVAFRSFVCDSETNTLKADPLIYCDADLSPEYSTIRFIGWVGVITWPVLVPLIYLKLLWAHYGPTREELGERIYHFMSGRALVASKHAADARRRGMTADAAHTQIKNEIAKSEEEQMKYFNLEKTAPSYLATLLEEYEPECWIMPVVEQYSKMGVTCATIFRNESVMEQLVIGMLVHLVTMLIQFSSKPFKDFNDDLYAMFSCCCMFLVMLFSLLVEFKNKMDREHAQILFLGGEPNEDMSGAMFEKNTLGSMMIMTCASVAFVFFVFVMFEMKAAFKTVKMMKKWDEVKGEAMEGRWTEEMLIEEVGGDDLSVVDRQIILTKYRSRVASRASGSGEGIGIEIGIGADDDDDDEEEEGEIEMSENPIGNKAAKAKAKAKAGERPFGGFGQQESVRHVSGADPVDLGGVDIVKSKHQKYKERGEEPPHVARAAGFNSLKKGDQAKKPPPPAVKDDEENAEWIEKWDEDEHATFYVNRVTGNSVWDKP